MGRMTIKILAPEVRGGGGRIADSGEREGLAWKKIVSAIPLLLIPILITYLEWINDPSILFIYFRMSVKCELFLFIIFSSVWHLNKSDLDCVIFLFKIIGTWKSFWQANGVICRILPFGLPAQDLFEDILKIQFFSAYKKKMEIHSLKK